MIGKTLAAAASLAMAIGSSLAVADLGTTIASPLQKVGEAKLRVLFWDIYYSRLYTQTGDYQRGQRPLKLEIQYLLDIKSDALVARTRTEWEDQGLEHENQEQWLANLGELWPDVNQNDVLVLEIDDDNRSTFYHNGNRLGVIDDAGFGQQFVDIWLAPTTTRPELRLALIGADN